MQTEKRQLEDWLENPVTAMVRSHLAARAAWLKRERSSLFVPRDANATQEGLLALDAEVFGIEWVTGLMAEDALEHLEHELTESENEYEQERDIASRIPSAGKARSDREENSRRDRDTGVVGGSPRSGAGDGDPRGLWRRLVERIRRLVG